MRKIFFWLAAVFVVVYMISGISAQLMFTSQPNPRYSLGDVAHVSANVLTSADLSDFFSVNLICNGISTTVYQEYLSLSAGTQKDINISIPLTQKFVGGTSGLCNIKAILDKDYIVTNGFQVSNNINVTISSTGRVFKPGQQIFIQGNAVKANNKSANGVANISISFDNSSVYTARASVKDGFFYFNFSLPSDSPAGEYPVKTAVYEFDSSGLMTNSGSNSFDITVNQVPTSLELILANKSKVAGGTLEARAILHDQTGERINSSVNFSIVDENGEVVDQRIKKTGETLKVPISYNSPPSKWTVYATSDGLSTQSYFDVLKNEKISVDLFNGTLIVTNKGNVPYSKPLSVLIGNNKSLVFNLSLGVGQSKKFALSAPNGNYSVEVSSEGHNLFSGTSFLTGNAVNLHPVSDKILSLVQFPWVWGFVLFILIAAAIFFILRIRKKRFVGKANLNKLKPALSKSSATKKEKSTDDLSLMNTNKADMSLSMKGDKQDSSVTCLFIRNFDEIKSTKNNVGDTLKKIISLSESSKAAVYETENYIFFIFAPAKTKTFRNEKDAVKTAEQIKEILTEHNRLFKQKVDFGISVNHGTIIANHSPSGLKFMSLGDFSSVAKRLASISKGDILLSDDIRDRLMSDVKTESKQSQGNLDYYVLTQIKDNSKNEKFLKDFMRRMDMEKK